MDSPIVVSYGAGVNSTAMLVGMVERGIVPRAILFSDTGGEKPATYVYLDLFDKWLQEHGMPAVSRLKYRPSRAGSVVWTSLEDECLTRNQLPSLAYGWHKCSAKWKVKPQMLWLEAQADLQESIASGKPVQKAIGFRLGEERRRKEHIQDPGTIKIFPLQDWKWDQEDCYSAIARAALPIPPKSSCFFCPATTATEVATLWREAPELADRAVAMERAATAAGNLQTVVGLGRHWTWESVIEYEKRKQFLFDLGDTGSCSFRNPMDTPCGCYDGGDDDD